MTNPMLAELDAVVRLIEHHDFLERLDAHDAATQLSLGFTQMAARFFRTHHAEIAAAVDVEKVAAVGYEAWMDDPGLWLHANNMERSRWTKIAQAIITRALSGEKAGPVGDGLRFPEWVIESLGVLDAETQRLYLDPTDGNKVGLNERCAITFFKRFATDPEEACRMYGTLTASPTPDKEGA